jgi:ABC-2 type transport system permease protein
MWLLVEALNAIISVTVYYFMGFQVIPGELEAAGYGTSYLGFAALGIATQTFLWTSIARIAMTLRREMSTGTFEALTTTQLLLRNYLFGQALAGFIISLWEFLLAMVVAVWLLGAPFVITLETLIAGIIVLIIMVLAHLGIGFLATAAIMILKKGDPITGIIAVVSEFLGGVLFPLNVLPKQLVLLARIIPYSYALRAFRFIFLRGATLQDATVLNDVLICLGITIVLIPLGLWLFHYTHSYAKRKGIAGHY